MGWPAVFYLSGTLAVIWYFAWSILVFDSPEDHPRITPQEKRFLEMNLQKRIVNEDVRKINLKIINDVWPCGYHRN